MAADVEHFAAVLGGELVFAIEAYGTRVAMVRLGERPPGLIFADHVHGERPILVYRVESLEGETARLAARGWEQGDQIEIPHGPCCSFTTPGGHRLAIYELTRPEVPSRFEGRRDF